MGPLINGRKYMGFTGFFPPYTYIQVIPSLKLTVKAPENGWLEDDRFLLGPGQFSWTNCQFWGEGNYPETKTSTTFAKS